jgi:hypothetical protein
LSIKNAHVHFTICHFLHPLVIVYTFPASQVITAHAELHSGFNLEASHTLAHFHPPCKEFQVVPSQLQKHTLPAAELALTFNTH